MAGVLRLPILDGLLDELDAFSASDGTLLRGPAAHELERLAELLLTGMLGASAEAIQRRILVVELLRRADGGRLPVLVADTGDAFGVELRAMLASDEDLRSTLGRLYPLASRATSVAPSPRWVRDARASMSVDEERAASIGAVRRVLAALVRAELVSRPDILVGGLRLANQRFARGLVWLAGVSFDAPAETLASIGLRMGTSGRSDAVVRDTALANSAAALLGQSADEGAAAALASMRLEITNRVVLKQVDRALAAQASRAGVPVEELIDAALPTFGLNLEGRRTLEAPSAAATIDVSLNGRVAVTWRQGDGEPLAEPSAAIEAAEPGLIADAGALADRIEAALGEERRRHEQRLGSERTWSLGAWRRRFADHPLGRIAARTLIWVVDDGSGPTAVLPELDQWATSDERPLRMRDDQTVGMWHPVDAGAGEGAAWRATLAARGITQAVRQADREVFTFDPESPSSAADVRHAGAIVGHSHLRAILRRRGWAVPALGAWDQGDEATAWHAFDDDLRAELRYQAPDRVPTGERVERARLVAVRFVRTDSPPASPADRSTTVLLTDVPPRVFSEALRDVSLVVAS